MKFAAASAMVLGLPFLSRWVMTTDAEQVNPDIIGGRDVYDSEVFPWFAAGTGCGGTLIHEDIVLTAAHCQGQFDDFVQIGGRLSPLVFAKRLLDGEIIDTVCTLAHPDYVSIDGGNDIALVKLASFSFAPLMALSSAPPAADQLVTAIGYGSDAYGQIPEPSILQVLTPIYVQSQDVCNAVPTTSNIPDTVICVDDNDPVTSICQGDSGGPIFTESFVQVGIASFVLGDCLGDRPSYWTDVSQYASFIQFGICSLSANPPADCPTDLPPAPAACLVGTPAPAPSFSPQPVTPTPTGGDGKMDGGMSGGSKEGMSGGSKEGMSGGSKGGMSGGSKNGMSGGAKGGTKKSDDAPKAPKTAKTSGRN